jgi:hypothetical protein
MLFTSFNAVTSRNLKLIITLLSFTGKNYLAVKGLQRYFYGYMNNKRIRNIV